MTTFLTPSAEQSRANREADRLREASLIEVQGVRVSITDIGTHIKLGSFSEEQKRNPKALAALVEGGFASNVRDLERARENAAEERAEAEAGALVISVSAHMIGALRQAGFLWQKPPHDAKTVIEAFARALSKGVTLTQLESMEVDGSRTPPGVLRQIPVSAAFQPSRQTGRGASDLSLGPAKY